MSTSLSRLAAFFLGFAAGMPVLAAAHEPPASWLAEAARRIEAAEYEVSASAGEAGYQAPNRAQGFRTHFSPVGIRAVPRVESSEPWEWGLTWVAYGRGAETGPVPEATLAPAKNRMEYRRGPFTEWYENRPDGLEQGFLLPVPPERLTAGDGSEVPVHLDLALSGTLRPVFAEDGQAIDFVGASGERILRYAELHVTDARGTVLPSLMGGFSRAGVAGIRLLVDDRDAVYPLTVDPLTTAAVWSNESNQVSAEYGKSVGTAGDVNGDGYSDVIVGAPFYDNGQTDEGRAYLYLGSASGLAGGPAWTGEGEQGGARYGWSVGTAGDVNGDGYSDVIVGAPLYDNGQTDEGRAYVYLGGPSGLALTAAWTEEIDQASARFAWSVGTAGDVNGDGFADVIVGAYLFDNGQVDEGAAFAYLGSASGPATSPVWTTESNQASAQYGWAVATAGDTNGDGFADVLVGAPQYDNGHTNEGRAWLYPGNASGISTSHLWVQESNQAGAGYGYSVGTAGDVLGSGYASILVGAWLYDNGQVDEGRVFLYTGGPIGPPLSALWTAESDNAGGNMGFSVGTAGDVNGDGYADLLVTAAFYTIDVSTGGGQARVYLGGQSGPSGFAMWTVTRLPANAAYGWSAATAGDVNGDGYADVLIGAPWDDNGQNNEGLAYLYYGSPNTLGNQPAWTESNQAGARIGWTVNSAGDVNGDGYGDLVMGAPFFDNGETDEGKVFLLLGSATSPIATPWNVETNQAFSQFGTAVGTAGDVNGDGFDDVVVGAPLYDGSAANEGRASLYLGSAAGLATTPAWTVLGGVAEMQVGWSVGAAGDVNGDGFADWLVGAPWDTNGQSFEGRALLFLGSAGTLSTGAAWVGEVNQATARFGTSLGTAGDVNGDGYSDVIVGAPFFDNGQTDEGRAYVYLGSASGLAVAPSWTVDGDVPFAFFGTSVSSAGDVNGDGYADVIVGAYGSFTPWASIYHGSATGLPPTASFTLVSTGDAGSEWGTSVAGAGDVNGDGYAEVVIGSPLWDNSGGGGTIFGAAVLYPGSAAGVTGSGAVNVQSGISGDRFGLWVASAGDLNGDGYADLAVGAPYHNGGQADEGRAWIFWGGNKALALNPRQRTAADTGPIARLGWSDDATSFRLAALGRTPFGRGRVRLEWEARPWGTPLDGTGTASGTSWVDTGLTGGALSELVSGLLPGTRQHWRLRLIYDPASVPFAARSRWVTVPWGGRNEAMLRTPAPAAGAGRSDAITLTKVGGGLTLSWTGNASCNPADTDHAIYEGTLGDFTSHLPIACTTNNGHAWNFTPAAGNRYFLLVPINGTREGSYGLGVGGAERPQSAAACRPQLVTCP